ncbi:MAG: hypothetical protein ACK55Z_29305, partial [bacterium]
RTAAAGARGQRGTVAPVAGGAACAGALSLPGQCARVGERTRTRGGAGWRPGVAGRRPDAAGRG